MAIAVGVMGWMCYLMYRTTLPHSHPLTVNVTYYENMNACTSPTQTGHTKMLFADLNCVRFNTSVKAVSMVWNPHHNIQWLEDFGDCTFMLFDTPDCSVSTSSVLNDFAQKDKFGKCYDVAITSPRSASMKCEKEWEATWCEKSDGLRERNRITCGTSPVCKTCKKIWNGLWSWMPALNGWNLLTRLLW